MRHAGLVTASGGALVTLIVTGCGGTTTPTSLPARVSPASPTASASVATTPPAQQVTGAYTTFSELGGIAERSTPAQARAMLAPYVAEPYLDHLLAAVATYRARNKEAWGHVVPHITQVTVNGDGALVRDCQDDSHAALADSRSGTVLPHSAGSTRTNIVATLTRGSDGRWRLTALEQLDTPCEPEPSPS